MKALPLWVRIIGCVVGAAMIAYAIYGLSAQFMASKSGAITVSVVLGAWVAAYLIWGRKLAAIFRK